MLRLITYCFLLLLSVQLTFAQRKKIELELILQSHFKFIRQANTSSRQNLRLEGTFQQGATKAGLTIYKARTGNWRQEISIGSQKAITAIKGTSGWELNPFSGQTTPTDFSKEQLSQLLEISSMDSPLWLHRQKGSKISLLKDSVINDRALYQIAIGETNAPRLILLLDKATYRIAQMTYPATADTYLFDDYRAIEGVILPFKITRKIQQLTITYSFTEVAMNQDLSPALFDRPNIKSVEDIAKEYLKTFYELNYDKLITYYTDSSVWVDPSTKLINPDPNFETPESIGAQKIIDDLKAGFNGVRNAAYEFKESFYSREFAVIYGIYTYEISSQYFTGASSPAANFKFELPMNTILVIREGKVLKHTEYGDWASWLRQANEQATKLATKPKNRSQKTGR